MSFTTDVKKEIIASGVSPQARAAALSALLKTSGNVGTYEGKPAFYFVSETENVAEFFMTTFFEEFGIELYVSHATMDRMSGRDKLVIQCPQEHAEAVAKSLGLIKRTGGLKEGIPAAFSGSEEKRIAYLCGAFLGGGSCTLPTEGGKTGYHLEIVFPERKLARDFCRLLTDLEIIPKLTERKDSHIAYIKSKELISDFLSVIGAEACLKKFSALVERRDRANNDNRARNCIAGNADKAAIAAVKQIVAIEGLKKRGVLGELSVELRALARARTDNPTLSLQELADKLGVSKSCLNHRMRKLMEIAGEEE